MMDHLLVYIVVGAALGIGVASLAIYRRILARAEFDVLHIADHESEMISQQQTLAQRLAKIDRWGMLMTIIFVAYAIALGVAYCYQVFEATGKIGQ